MKGNVEDHEKLVYDYKEKYKEYIYYGKKAIIEDLTAEDLQRTARVTNETAAVLDQWASADLKMLPLKAYGYLADLLNDVEKGAPCPEQLRNARAAFLSKDPEDELNPLAYRVLLMLAALYRMWSNTRLRHMAP